MSVIRLYFIKAILRRVKNRADYKNIIRARRGFEKMVSKFNKPMKGFGYAPFTIGEMKAEWITPQGADEKKVLLFFHGGGYATGSIDTHRSLVSKIAANTGVKALLIDYRLAPENKYPAPIHDAAEAYQWLLDNGYSANNIALGGDSAGGGVTMGTLLYLRDNNIPLPKCAIGLSPWVDQTVTGDSVRTQGKIDPMLIAEALPLWAGNYMGTTETNAPYASPIFHNLQGLPPIYIQVGGEEVLYDDSIRFEQRAKQDGVDIKLDIYPKGFHVFQAFWRILPEARDANRKLGAFIKQQLA